MKPSSRRVVIGLNKMHQALASGPASATVLALLSTPGQLATGTDHRWRKVGSQEVYDCPVVSVDTDGMASELHIQITRSPGQPASEQITFLDLQPGTDDIERWLARMSEALGSSFGPSEMLGTAERYRKTTEQVQKTLLEPNGGPARLLMVRRGAVRNR